MDTESWFDFSRTDVSVSLPVEAGHQTSTNPFSPASQNVATFSQWNPFRSTPEDYNMKMVDEENNIIQSQLLQNMENLNLGQGNSTNPTNSDSLRFLDLTVDNTLFPAQDWVVPPPSEFCQDNHHTLNVRDWWAQEAPFGQPLDETVGTDLLHDTPVDRKMESPSLSRDDHTEFLLSGQEEDTNNPSSQSNYVFQRKINTARFFKTSKAKTSFRSLRTTSNSVSQTVERNSDIAEEESSPLSPTLMQSNINTFDDVFDVPVSPENDGQFEYKKKTYDMPHASTKPDTDTSHMGSENGVRETSVTGAPWTSSSPNGNLNYGRLPPILSPRSKAPQTAFSNLNTTLLQTSPSTLTSHGTANIQNMTYTAENDLPVYEDVLLTGQEFCVEGWSATNPELSSDWKPTGKLKLRRDSIRVSDIDGTKGHYDTKKQKKKVKVKFIPQRGFVIGFDKDSSNPELKGACGYSVHPDIEAANQEKDFLEGGDLCAFSDSNEKHPDVQYCRPVSEYSRKKSFSIGSLRTPDKMASEHFRKKSFSIGSLRAADSMAANGEKGADLFTPFDSKEKHQEMQDCRPKKPSKFKGLRLQKSQSKSFEEAEVKLHHDTDHNTLQQNKPQKPKQLGKLKRTKNKEIPNLPEDFDFPCAASEEYFLSGATKNKETKHFPEDFSCLTSEDYFLSDGAKDIKPHKPLSIGKLRKWSKNRETKDFPEDFSYPTSEDYFLSDAAKDIKPKKTKHKGKHLKRSKKKETKDFHEDLYLPSPSSEDPLSDAAKAEWMSAQMDMKRSKSQEEKESLESVEEDGDTDSLMEWWNTVEFWDELPPEEKIGLKEDENESFKAIADKVQRGLRVYLKLFMERAELLYQHVLILYAIADDLIHFHQRAKIANITGGTTTAVGGAAAITGLALAPVTFGASILISAIGLGIATAGGITAASATISDNFNNMHDRKKIEIIVQDYEDKLLEMQHCLKFITEGLRRLHGHPLLRRNNYYLGDWEVRRALQTISLVTDPVGRAEEVIDNTMARLKSLHKGMDRYFTKDSKDVKKGCKKEVTSEVRTLARHLQEDLLELNSIREKLLDAIGNL